MLFGPIKPIKIISPEKILLSLTIIGLALQLYLFLKMELNSDIVSPGLISIEFWKYHNYFLSNYYLPYADPFIFGIMTFHLLPQILSNYNPMILKLILFFYFLFVVIIFSYIIFISTKKLLNTFFFSALLSSWYTFNWYSGYYHEFTMFIIGILLLLYFFKPIKHWSIVFFIILAIETWSDSLILIWFTIPILFTIIILNLKFINRLKISGFEYKMIFVSTFIFILKKFVKFYSSANYIQCHELGCLSNKIPIIIKTFGINNQIKFIDILFLVFLIAYLVLLTKNIKSILKKDISIYFIIMSVITLLFYIISWVDLYSFRYLMLVSIGIVSLFCFMDFDKSKYTKLFLSCLIIINLLNLASVVAESHNSPNSPNEEQYKLIDFLKKSDLSVGYGDYWDSGIITYLSHEDVEIRPVEIGNGMKPYYWMGAQRWYDNIPKRFFIIVRTTDKNAINYYDNYSSPQIIDYKNYKIFIYND